MLEMSHVEGKGRDAMAVTMKYIGAEMSSLASSESKCITTRARMREPLGKETEV